MSDSRFAVDTGHQEEHLSACGKHPKEGDVAARPSFRLAFSCFRLLASNIHNIVVVKYISYKCDSGNCSTTGSRSRCSKAGTDSAPS